MILKSNMNKSLNSRKWLNEQKRNVWLNVNDIPGSIFWSVWNYIETKNVSLHKDKSLYKLH